MSVQVTCGDREYFPGHFEGFLLRVRTRTTALAFKHYDENRIVAGKPMKDHFRFAVAVLAFLLRQHGVDPLDRRRGSSHGRLDDNPMEAAREKLDAAFEFVTKLGAAVLLLPRSGPRP